MRIQMKSVAFVFRHLYILAMCFSGTCTQGMQLTSQQLASQAEEHSNNQFIMSLPDEMLMHVFSYCGINDVKKEQIFTELVGQCIALKNLCKRFSSILTIKVIGQLHKRYAIESKNRALESITKNISSTNYQANRVGVLTLLYSGANPNTGAHMNYSRHIQTRYSDFSLLHKVLIERDVDLLSLLLYFNANPNQIHPNKGPLFFFAPTVNIVDLFVNKGADLNSKDKNGNNVLWYVHRLSRELIEFYIEHKVDMRYINPSDNTSLLHALANPSVKYINNSNGFFEKGVLLVEKIPDMLNVIDKSGKTPIDLMQEKIKREFYNNSMYYAKPFKQLITLYIGYGGKTAQELTQNK